MYRIVNRGDTLEVLIYEDIGGGLFGGVSAKQVVDDIKAANPQMINVRINSPGGDVFDGLAIHNYLRDHQARVEVDIDSLAASAASLIAMSGDEIRMADNALMMIHNAWTVVAGDSHEMERMSELLKQINTQLVKSYAAQTDMDAAEIQGMMDEETWMDSETALGFGFVDSVTSDMAIAASFIRPEYKFRNMPEVLLKKSAGNEWKSSAEKRKARLKI